MVTNCRPRSMPSGISALFQKPFRFSFALLARCGLYRNRPTRELPSNDKLYDCQKTDFWFLINTAFAGPPRKRFGFSRWETNRRWCKRKCREQMQRKSVKKKCGDWRQRTEGNKCREWL